jgi:hypothetical protein
MLAVPTVILAPRYVVPRRRAPLPNATPMLHGIRAPHLDLTTPSLARDRPRAVRVTSNGFSESAITVRPVARLSPRTAPISRANS